MFNILSRQENATQNYLECPPYIVGMTIIKKINNKDWQGCREKEPLLTPK
jgi:hypothetical protein